MSRRLSELAVSIGSVAVVLLAMAWIDPRVRQHAWLAVSGVPGAPADGGHMSMLAAVVYDALRHQTLEHAPLVIFAVAGVVVLFLMVRS